MSAISEFRRELGLVAAEYMQLAAELADIREKFDEQIDALQEKVKEQYEKLDEALDSDNNQ